MNEREDNKLWQMLGEASRPTPPADFSRRVMMRIMAEEQEKREMPVINAIPFFKRPVFRIWAGVAAAALVGVLGFIAVMEEGTPVDGTYLSAVNIDDVLVQEAGQSLGEENLMDALCTMAASETGVISDDSIQEFIL